MVYYFGIHIRHHWSENWVEMMMSELGKILKKYLEQANNMWKDFLDISLSSLENCLAVLIVLSILWISDGWFPIAYSGSQWGKYWLIHFNKMNIYSYINHHWTYSSVIELCDNFFVSYIFLCMNSILIVAIKAINWHRTQQGLFNLEIIIKGGRYIAR